MNFFKVHKNKIMSSELHVTYMSLVYIHISKMAVSFAWPSVSVHRRLAAVVNRKVVQCAWCDSVHGVTVCMV